jgi:hypothetical protein
LCRPDDGHPPVEGFALTSVGIVDGEAHRGPSHPGPRWDGPPLVVTFVVAVQHHASARTSDDDDDLILVEDWQTECTNVEGSCLREIRDEENQALETVGSHDSRSLCSLPRGEYGLDAQIHQEEELVGGDQGAHRFDDGGVAIPCNACDKGSMVSMRTAAPSSQRGP